MSLITFIPIPTKFVGAGFPADVYIYNAPRRCGVAWCGVVWCGVVWRGVAHGAVSVLRTRVYAAPRVPSGACLSTTPVVSLLKFAIEDNPQIDRNLDDKAATASIGNFIGSWTRMAVARLKPGHPTEA